MRVTVTLAIRQKETDDNLITKTYEHVHNAGVQPNTGLYTLINVDGQPIAHLPLGLLVAVEFPAHDTNLSLIPGKVTL